MQRNTLLLQFPNRTRKALLVSQLCNLASGRRLQISDEISQGFRLEDNGKIESTARWLAVSRKNLVNEIAPRGEWQRLESKHPNGI